jgi:UDP-N-acetylmuramate: L-alanyl-gamma-D-glutamyl-meso-diaminopimelate ligase
LVRTVPANGLIVANGTEASLARVLERGCWTPVERFGPGQAWSVGAVSADDAFEVVLDGEVQGTVRWHMTGDYSRHNALAALAAARHAGVPLSAGIDALSRFEGVKRRMEVRGTAGGVTVYDDFAHHPTAFAATIAGLRKRVGSARILAVFEPRSNTMKLGAMQSRLAGSLEGADLVFCHASRLGWDAQEAMLPLSSRAAVFSELEPLVEALQRVLLPGDHVLVMSNGGFGDIHARLLARLAAAKAPA